MRSLAAWVSVIVIGFIRGAAEAGDKPITDPNFALAIVGSGMCGGIAYWLVAGRTAGNWRQARAAISPAP